MPRLPKFVATRTMAWEKEAVNQSPIANAGKDTTIILPEDTVYLNGSFSTDPDNNIISYQWTKVDGPASFTIANANSVAIYMWQGKNTTPLVNV